MNMESSFASASSIHQQNGFHHNSSLSLIESSSDLDRYSKKLDAMERIKDIIGSEKLSLPKICVIGNQSSGKSTLLSKLVPGFENVLPQGNNTVTRCPIVIRMKKLKESEIHESITVEGSEFPWTNQGQRDAQEKIKEIQQSNIANENNKELGFSNISIKVTVLHHNVVDLELVDLPGIISNGEEGRIEFVKAMVKKAIEPPTTFILVVHIANDDFEIAPAFKLAKDVDQNGERTMVVLTKCDNFNSDDNEDRCKTLMKDAHKYHGVCCNSGGISIDKMSNENHQDIDHDPKGFYKLFPNNYGFRKLFEKRLPPLLENLLDTNIPQLANEIENQMKGIENNLLTIGEESPSQEKLVNDVQKFLLRKDASLKEETSKFILDLHKDLVSIGEKEINVASMKEKVKPNVFFPIKFQGSDQFLSYIIEISEKMVPHAKQTIQYSINAITKVIDETMKDKKSVHSGLRYCWVQYKKELQETCYKLLSRLEEETKVYISIDDIVERNEASLSNSTVVPTSGNRFDNRENIAKDLIKFLENYYVKMTNTFTEKVMTIISIDILQSFFEKFVLGLQSNEKFKSYCVDDPEREQARTKNKDLREKLQKCQDELANL